MQKISYSAGISLFFTLDFTQICAHHKETKHYLGGGLRRGRPATADPASHFNTGHFHRLKKATLPFDFALRDVVHLRGPEGGPQNEGTGQEQGPRVHIQGLDESGLVKGLDVF